MALKGYSRLLLAWGVAMMTAGCPGSSLENAALDITRVAKVSVDQGTSKVMGTVRIPAGALDAQASDPQRWVFVEGATVAVADANAIRLPAYRACGRMRPALSRSMGCPEAYPSGFG